MTDDGTGIDQFRRMVCMSVTLSVLYDIGALFPVKPPTIDVMVQMYTPHHLKKIICMMGVDIPLRFQYDLDVPFCTDPSDLLARVTAYFAPDIRSKHTYLTHPVELSVYRQCLIGSLTGMSRMTKDEIHQTSQFVSNVLCVPLYDRDMETLMRIYTCC